MDTSETRLVCPACTFRVEPGFCSHCAEIECPDCGYIGYDWEWRGEVAPVLREAVDQFKVRIRAAESPFERIAIMNHPSVPFMVRLIATIEYGQERG